MLTAEQIEQNKNEFIYLLSTIQIPGADIKGLVEYLLASDFFEAPASTLYHCNYAGGLCYHSLNVYKTLLDLTNLYVPGKYDKSTLIAVALLHDISKVNFYEKTIVNKKIYNEQGSKKDNLGKYEWVAEEAYKVKPAEERFLAGSHEENSMLIASRFIPFNMEEIVAIMHHHCNSNDGNQLYDLSAILNKYPLLTLLHSADFLSCFLKEAN